MRIDLILNGLLAGSPRPGLLDPLEKDLEQLKSFGFQVIVNLTETPFDLGAMSEHFEVIHFPILDMGAPTPEAMQALSLVLWRRIDKGIKILVHCKAGLGRTGTVLACLLLSRGRKPEQAMTEVRLVNPRFIQSDAQEHFVHRFASYLEARAQASTG